ncbi:hypothetical protein [Dyadobacter sp.]|uniref:hypothetical protein n=1 Tax=Dyadobacter sp. TaxID=1914288 RepID=UPI0032666937
MNVQSKGWVVVNHVDTIVGWAFSETRKGSIENFAGSIRGWRYWRKRGYRCIKATKTVTITER